jgi:hypothetical protein
VCVCVTLQHNSIETECSFTSSQVKALFRTSQNDIRSGRVNVQNENFQRTDSYVLFLWNKYIGTDIHSISVSNHISSDIHGPF